MTTKQRREHEHLYRRITRALIAAEVRKQMRLMAIRTKARGK